MELCETKHGCLGYTPKNFKHGCAWRGFAWCAIVLPEMVSSVPGASVMSGDVGLGGGGFFGVPVTVGMLGRWPGPA